MLGADSTLGGEVVLTKGGSSVLSIDMSRFIDVWVTDAIVTDVAEIMEDERLWDLECLTWFPLRWWQRNRGEEGCEKEEVHRK